MDPVSILQYIQNANKEEQRAIKDQNMANALVEFMGMKPSPKESMVNQEDLSKSMNAKAMTIPSQVPGPEEAPIENTPNYLVNAPGNIPTNLPEAVQQRRSTLLDQITGSEKGQNVIAHIAQQRLIPKETNTHETETRELMGPDDKVHVYGWNPAQKNYSVDFGFAKMNADDRTGLSKDATSMLADVVRSGGDLDRLGFGKSGTKDREAVYNLAAKDYLKEKAEAQAKGQPFNLDMAVKRAERKALAGSLNNQEKVSGQMGAFVKNLDWQVDRLDKRIEDITRIDPRLLNMPIRGWNKYIAGSANESILSMYLTDISNDIAKLSTGSSASISELSTSAQDRWNKIHDPNLSVKDLKEILAETKLAGHGRIDTTKAQISETKSRIEKLNPSYVEPKKETPQGKISTWEELKKKKGY